MYRILHASADYLLCSFEFENMKTGEHVFADYFDDPLYDLLSLSLSCSLIMSWRER